MMQALPVRLKQLITAAIIVNLCSGCVYPHYPDHEWDSQCPSEPIEHPHSETARTMLLDALRNDRGAGISAAVMIDGAIVWQDAVGIAVRSEPLTTNARMRIGSVAKLFTAVAAARLAEDGKLDLDVSIRTYLPSLPQVYSPITIRQLATHTSGIRQYDFSSLREGGNREYYQTLMPAFDELRDDAVVAPAGTQYIYSSPAFNLIGIAIEQVSGEGYGTALERLVSSPMGLTNTMTDDSTRFTRCRAHFYSVLFGRWRIPTFRRDNSDLYPSGGLLSSTADLAQFAHQTLQSPLLSPATKTMMQERAALADGTLINAGFGWEIRHGEEGLIEWIGHGGTINGAYASVRYYPRHNMIVSAVANYDFVLTGRRAQFFTAIRRQLPGLFSADESAEFND